jgi:ribosomal protein S18 acetylase RimI-like enzyme
MPQLSSSSLFPTTEQLLEILNHDASTVLLAKERETIVGSMTLVVFPIPTGVRAWIEDVVVDEQARGRGVGEALNKRAIEIAIEAGAKTIDLTSRPSRAAANRLYQRLGFVARETNIYRYEA